eukprot:TRINITY_DN4050_c0_g1_i8.p1 TRINITY_DN4050_c0_g1~~TRINITY_DN4050_c0_g1_i8.p1  ORF type:complete len:332 (-),score=67.15 TRINITY_DN4050_c0_g1_i8:248-1243(-)
MKKIRSIEEDINVARWRVVQAREQIRFLDGKFKKSVLKVAKLHRRKAALERIHNVLNSELKDCLLQYRAIQECFDKSMYNKAYSAANKLNKALDKFLLNPKQANNPSLIILQQLKRKVENIEDEIKNGIDMKIRKILRKFSKEEYADLSEYYELHSNWKITDNALHPLFEHIRSEYKKIVSHNMKQVITRSDTKQRLRDLYPKIEIHNLIDILNEIFKFHVNLMYSHHQIISFHDRKHSRLKQEELKLQKNGTVKKQGLGFHQVIKALLMDDRKSLWSVLQLKVGKLFTGVQNRITLLAMPELFEILCLCCKYLLIGEEFSGMFASELVFA